MIGDSSGGGEDLSIHSACSAFIFSHSAAISSGVGMYPHPSSERFLHRLHISTDDLFRFPHIRHLPLAILAYFAPLFVEFLLVSFSILVLIPRHAPR